MKPAFCITNTKLHSAVVADNVEQALQVGDKLHLEHGFTTPWGPIPAGITCIVDNVSDDDGMVELYVPQYVKALEPWGKCIVLLPFFTDDIVGFFRLVTETALALIA